MDGEGVAGEGVKKGVGKWEILVCHRNVTRRLDSCGVYFSQCVPRVIRGRKTCRTRCSGVNR